MFFLAHVVDDELSGTAQGLFTMLVSMLMAIVTFFSGMLYAQLGGNAFWVMAAISFSALVLFFISRFFRLTKISVQTAQSD